MIASEMVIMLCGDVMLGRGIDQILPHPNPPVLNESYARSALDYVALAERKNGPVGRPAPFAYVWGEALAELSRRKPDVRIINLETAVTRADQPEPKGINYRMNPANLPCLAVAEIDCCVLANNHVLDWGHDGLLETIEAINGIGIRTAGAGRTLWEAQAPAVLDVPSKGRVLVYAAASASSGVPSHWSATSRRPGVNSIGDLSDEAARAVTARVDHDRRPHDIAVFSIHWGPNWGYDVSPRERSFAHSLIDSGQIDVVYGHSSHHFKGVEIYHNKPIFYGCGDFLNDYEGIGGSEHFRGDLVLLYFLTVSSIDRSLLTMQIVPYQIRNFRLNHVGRADAEWVLRQMSKQCQAFGGKVERHDRNGLSLA